jgi:predicted MFS family arabinose efflux permease
VLISFAFFAQDLASNFFDAQVPALLQNYITSAGLIGLIMGLDNIFGIFLQPWIGYRSDRLRTRIGRRIPIIAIGTLVAAVLLAMLPWATSPITLLPLVVLFALVANSYKAPTESLMPDFVPPAHRSKGSAILKIAGGITTIVTSVIGILVVDRSVELAFAIPSVLMIVAVGVMVLRLKETRSTGYQQALAEDAKAGDPTAAQPRFFAEVRRFLSGRDRRGLLILGAVVLVNGGWQAVRALLTPYAGEVLGMTPGQAGALTLPGGIAFILAAFPLAILADRIGPLRVLKGGAVVLLSAFILAYLWPTPTTTIAAITIGAIGWSAVVVNAIVVFWRLAPSQAGLGIYTGLFSVAYAIGAAVGPLLVGTAIDLTSWNNMMLFAAVLVAASFIVLLVVKVPRDELIRGKRDSTVGD